MRLHRTLGIGLLVVTLMSTNIVAAPMQFIYEGKEITIHIEPIHVKGKMYIPLRSFCDQMGYKVGWDSKKKEVTVTVKSQIIPVSTQKLIANKEGFIQDDRTYVTAEWVEKHLGAKIPVDDVGMLGVQVVTYLETGKYQEIIGMMDEVSAKMMDESVLRQSWESVTTQFGKVQSYSIDQVTAMDQGQQVDVKMICEKAHVKATTLFNEKKELIGLRFTMYTQEASLPKGAVEKEMVIQTGKYRLPATLTLPAVEGLFPVVILVHGSGPNDRDESIGGVKVFRDIAYGLAEQGIATLRYDKRNFVYREEYVTNPSLFNYEQEVIEDALSAIELMKKTNQINKDKIYVLGHSLGGMSVPMISTKDTGVAGYVMVASPARNMADLVLEQVSYLADAQGMPRDQKAIYMQMMQVQVDAVKQLKPDTQAQELGFMGFNNSMWAAFNSYNQVEVAKTITEPLLVVQGGRDYQVTMTDYKLWEEALKGKSNVSFKAYPELNHILVAGEGKSVPSEYYMPNEVSETFITDLGSWILKNATK